MKFDPPVHPESKLPPVGTLESVQGWAQISADEAGNYDYSGETKIDWDGQVTVTDSEGRVQLVDQAGNTWWAHMKDEFDVQDIFTARIDKDEASYHIVTTDYGHTSDTRLTLMILEEGEDVCEVYAMLRTSVDDGGRVWGPDLISMHDPEGVFDPAGRAFQAAKAEIKKAYPNIEADKASYFIQEQP